MSVEVAPLFAKTLKVRFTQPFELNDPFEFRPLIDFDGTATQLYPPATAADTIHAKASPAKRLRSNAFFVTNPDSAVYIFFAECIAPARLV
jgi:hypothetical protein